MKVLIIGSGSDLNSNLIKENLEGVNSIICADGGAKLLFKNEIIPNIIIGDLDSIDNELVDYYKYKEVSFKTFPRKKDKTDLELSIDYALSLGAKDITIIGATGSRLDHTIANVMLLYPIFKKGVAAKIVDNNNEILLVSKSAKITKTGNNYVSLIPLFKDAEGVTLKGFEYETKKLDFKFGSTFGISNKLKEKEGIIEIKSGICLLIKSRD
ncbi:MAG: thiamine diphosphokinase [Firmicutes bacterium]|nr:thiamine diphosphokinase [Bacillota bacterium]